MEHTVVGNCNWYFFNQMTNYNLLVVSVTLQALYDWLLTLRLDFVGYNKTKHGLQKNKVFEVLGLQSVPVYTQGFSGLTKSPFNWC